MKLEKKFYVAHPKITGKKNDSWAKATLKEAIDHARKILDKNPSQDSAMVVQIVRVVKRRQAPVTVETVK